MQRKGHPTVDPRSEWQQGMYDHWTFKLEHLQSTKPWKVNFHFVAKAYAAVPFSYMQRKGHLTMDPKSGRNQGLYYTGAFTLNYWDPKKPIFKNCNSTACSTSHFLHAEKRAPYSEPQKWMTTSCVWPLSIQIGQFVVTKLPTSTFPLY